MGITNVSFQQADIGDAYMDLYNVLKKMYWEASTIDTKDEVHSAMEEVGELIDRLDDEDLENNTAIFVALRPKMLEANKALQKIQEDVARITKNISTASSAIAAITKVLALVPKV